MYRDLWLVILKEVARLIVTIVITISIFLYYFHKQIVVVSLAELEKHIRSETSKISYEEAIREVGIFWANIGDKISQRKEIVLIKEAVVNSEQLKDITKELIKKKHNETASKQK